MQPGLESADGHSGLRGASRQGNPVQMVLHHDNALIRGKARQGRLQSRRRAPLLDQLVRGATRCCKAFQTHHLAAHPSTPIPIGQVAACDRRDPGSECRGSMRVEAPNGPEHLLPDHLVRIVGLPGSETPTHPVDQGPVGVYEGPSRRSVPVLYALVEGVVHSCMRTRTTRLRGSHALEKL